jgi:hypothetical protein
MKIIVTDEKFYFSCSGNKIKRKGEQAMLGHCCKKRIGPKENWAHAQ